MIFSENTVISFQESHKDYFKQIRERIRNKKPRISKSRADFLGLTLIDVVIDHYAFVLSQIGEQIEMLDDLVLTDVDEEVIQNINTKKIELNFIRKVVKPANDMILSLSKLLIGSTFSLSFVEFLL